MMDRAEHNGQSAKRARLACAMVLALGWTAFGAAEAATLEELWGVPSTVQAGAVYRGWTIDEAEGESKLSQWSFPIYFQTQLWRELQISYLFNAARSQLDFGDGVTNDLAGVTDGKLGFDYVLPDPRFAVGLGVRVPTGESVLDERQDNVARLLLDRLFGFYVRRYGEGTDLELRGGYSSAFGPNLAVAAGAGYLVKGTFNVADPAARDQLSSYDPGDEFALFASSRHRLATLALLVRLRLALFGADQRDGQPELEEGTQLAVELNARQEMLRGMLEAGAEFLFKEETKIFGEENLVPLRDVGGDIVRLSAGYSGRLDQRTTLGGRLGLAFFGESSVGTGDGALFEIGPFGSYALLPDLAIRAEWMLMTGNAENETIDLRGNAVSVSVSWGAVR